MDLKKHILILFLITFFSGLSVSQDKEEITENIRGDIEDIHLDTNLRIISLENEEFMPDMTDGGGELSGFYDSNGIRKIYKSIGISYGVGITEFYYKKNKLIFVREKFNSYVYDEKTGSFDYTKLNNTFSGSYYFYKGKIIDSKVSGNRNFKDNSSGIEESLKKESDEAVQLISKTIKKIPDNNK